MAKARTKARRTSAPRRVRRPVRRQPIGRVTAAAGPPSTPSSRLAATAEAVGSMLGATVRSLSKHAPWGNGANHAIDLLERDHRRLEDLLKKGDDTTARGVKERQALLETITTELKAHEKIEETILYPALKPHAVARDIVLEGYQEHHVADLLIAELHALPPSDERWGAKFKVLKENIEHHIEEEEGEMFRKARSVLGRAELEEMGDQMAAMKADAIQR